MAENVPETTAPAPICKLTKPLALVVGDCVSLYATVPDGDPCKTLIFIPITVEVTSALLLLRITAW
jgi:hypothetical protein